MGHLCILINQFNSIGHLHATHAAATLNVTALDALTTEKRLHHATTALALALHAVVAALDIITTTNTAVAAATRLEHLTTINFTARNGRNLTATNTTAVVATRLKTRLEGILESTRRQDRVDGRDFTTMHLARTLVRTLRLAALVAARALGLGTTNLALFAGLASRALLARLDQNRVDFAT